MICPNCQHNQDDSIANCEKCNFSIHVYLKQQNQPQPLNEQFQSQPNNTSVQTTTTNKYVLIGLASIGILFIVLMIFAMFTDDTSSGSNDPSLGLSSSYFTEISTTTTIGRAFNNFFEQGKWTNYKKNDVTYIEYTGYCTFSNENTLATITFLDGGLISFQLGDIIWYYSNYRDSIDIDDFLEVIYS